MRQKYSANAINLKSYDFGEADKIVMMYSKERGLIRCMAKGSKKPNGKLCGRMDMFVANNLLLTKGKSMDTVSQAETVNSFFRLRQDTDKLFFSMYCVETVKNFGEENDENSDKLIEDEEGNEEYILVRQPSRHKKKYGGNKNIYKRNSKMEIIKK